MTAMARHFDDLGPDFDLRWKRSSRSLKRELIGELRDLYIFLEEDDMPLLAGSAPRAATTAASRPAPGKAAVNQGQLFSDAGEPDSATPTAAAAAPALPNKDNPFLPKSVLERLQSSQTQASAGLRELMKTPATPPSHEQVDLERELRLRLGPVVESLIDAHVETLKSELRVRLRAEMDRLISEHVRKG
ncbi:MAG TPA: hypothetical protein VF050_02590 [Moraxellaceae bacterium]